MVISEKDSFQRTELLVGNGVMERLAAVKVIIFGVGGVGSWCAESLVRSGVKRLTVVDSDRICVSNINRQLHATTHTVGQVKTQALKQRLLDINPCAAIIDLQKVYSAETSKEFELDNYDYIIDAIDSLENKVHLIRTAARTRAALFSSMGAALKIDPSRIQVAEFWNVQGCPMGAALRRKMRKGELPAKPFLCVFSDEVLPNREIVSRTIEQVDFQTDTDIPDWNKLKAQINGTAAHITAIFGFTLAGLVLQDVYRQ